MLNLTAQTQFNIKVIKYCRENKGWAKIQGFIQLSIMAKINTLI